jgi:hypothetical protein
MPCHPLHEQIKMKHMNMRFLLRCTLTLLSLLATSMGTSQTNSLPKVQLPSLPSGVIELRVAHVVNPRLPRMSDSQLTIMLQQIEKTTLEHFGLQVKFAPLVEIPVAAVFASIPPKFQTLAAQQTYDRTAFFQRLSRLQEAFAKGLAQSGESLASQAEFAKPHTPQAELKSFDQLGKAIADLQLANFKRWSSRTALDGKSVIDNSRFHEFMQWNHLGYGKLPFEFVITNQIIASVEYVLPAVHSAVRGGYSNGITSFNPLAKYGTYSAWSTYAFTENDADWLQWRNGERYTPEEAARLAGIAATHELGHQLLHLLYPFGQKGCIMSPVPMFAYRAWEAQLSAKDCAIGSSSAMTPGAYSFRYIPP